MNEGMDMNIALIGYGSMGREVESAAIARGHHIVSIHTLKSPLPEPETGYFLQHSIECCIDVSAATAVAGHARICSSAGIPLVVGTTGWQQERGLVLEIVRKNNGTMIYGNNFSVGAQLFFAIVRTAARLMNAFDAYDIALQEIHHSKKKDAPSGTALSLAQIIIDEIERKRSVMSPVSGIILPDQVGISSTRIGTVGGIHSVLFQSAADEIELVHRAHNRSGFASGAVFAAELTQQYTGIHSFDELIITLTIHPQTKGSL